MIINDKIYGVVTIYEAVLIALITSPPMQRLKQVTMGGIVAILGISPCTTRFEHSVGTMLLVRLLGASIEEQAAALLHDVSHTAFSHVIDYAYGRASSQDFHDDVKSHYIYQTEIPSICTRHNIDLEFILDESQHSLLEQPLPRLCADRVDYTLRDLEPLGVASHSEVLSLLINIIHVRGRIAFTNAASARVFADAYMTCSTRSWSNPHHLAIYELCGNALRLAFEANLLSQNDIWNTDENLWKRLQEAAKNCLPIAELIDKMLAKTKYVPASQINAEIIARSKVRWIDPEVSINGDIAPLSLLSSSYANTIKDYQRMNTGIVHLRKATGGSCETKPPIIQRPV